MEHIEEAGVHSGDSACTLPPVTLGRGVIDQVTAATKLIAVGIGVRGLLNVQFAVSAGVLYVLEANPRASRTVPFVSKAMGTQLAKAASLIMVGRTITDLVRQGHLPEHDGSVVSRSAPVAVKEAVLPFKRFRTVEGRVVDAVLGPEMRSTGEVMGIDRNFPLAFRKSQDAAYGGLPTSGTVFVSVADRDKRSIVLPMQRLAQLGFTVLATEGTADILARNGVPVTTVRKHYEADAGEESIIDLIRSGSVDLIINTPSGRSARADGMEIRREAVAADKALVTTIAQVSAAVAAIESSSEPINVRSLQEYAVDRASW
jgi:carbamoyl-phosphate synthase large subunit